MHSYAELKGLQHESATINGERRLQLSKGESANTTVVRISPLGGMR